MVPCGALACVRNWRMTVAGPRLFFVGFGAPCASLSFFWSPFVNAGAFAIVFPMVCACRAHAAHGGAAFAVHLDGNCCKAGGVACTVSSPSVQVPSRWGNSAARLVGVMCAARSIPSRVANLIVSIFVAVPKS